MKLSKGFVLISITTILFFCSITYAQSTSVVQEGVARTTIDKEALITSLLNQVKALLAAIETIKAERTAGTSQTVNTQTSSTQTESAHAATPHSDSVVSVAARCLTLSKDLYLERTDGDSNGEVSKLQRFLAQFPAIYPEGSVTGFFGPATERAIQKWQREHGVVSFGDAESTGYGFVGKRTRAALACVAGSSGSVESVSSSESVGNSGESPTLNAPISTSATTLATYRGYLSGSLFIETNNISRADALENCFLNARNNPTKTVRCTWSNEELYNNTGVTTSVIPASTTYAQGSYYSEASYYSQASYSSSQATTATSSTSNSSDWVGGCANPPIYTGPDAIVGKYYTYDPGVYNAGAPYPSLPSGLTKTNGIISGTPATAGSVSVKVYSPNSCGAFLITFNVLDQVIAATDTYRAYLNNSTYANITTANISEADALTNCKLNAASNPSKSIRCTWGSKEIYSAAGTPTVSPPTVSISAAFANTTSANGSITVPAGTPMSVWWSSAGATSCTVSANPSSVTIAGSGTGLNSNFGFTATTQQTTFTATCLNSIGQSASASVTILPAPVPTPVPAYSQASYYSQATYSSNPTVDLKVNGSDGPIALTDLQPITVSWTSSGVATCGIYGVWETLGAQYANITSLPTSGTRQLFAYVPSYSPFVMRLRCSTNATVPVPYDDTVSITKETAPPPPPPGGTGERLVNLANALTALESILKTLIAGLAQ